MHYLFSMEFEKKRAPFAKIASQLYGCVAMRTFYVFYSFLAIAAKHNIACGNAYDIRMITSSYVFYSALTHLKMHRTSVIISMQCVRAMALRQFKLLFAMCAYHPSAVWFVIWNDILNASHVTLFFPPYPCVCQFLWTKQQWDELNGFDGNVSFH